MKDSMITLKEVAEIAGVSSTTVANVLHGRKNRVSADTYEKVNKILKDMNYVSNMGGRIINKSGSRIIAIIVAYDRFRNVCQSSEIDPFCGAIVGAIEKEMTKYNYFVMLYASSDIEKCLNMALAWNVEGIILLGAKRKLYYLLHSRLDIPIVTIDTCFKKQDRNYINIGLEDEKGGYEITKYLIENGHKNIMFAELEPQDDENGILNIDEARKRGYERALSENGLDKGLEDSSTKFLKLDLDIETRENQLVELVNNRFNNCSAIFFASDLLAVEAMNVFFDNGIKVPEDISVVGFDDSIISRKIRPGLTTVRQDIIEKGKKSVENIMQIINGEYNKKNDYINVQLPIKVIKRQTVLNLNE